MQKYELVHLGGKADLYCDCHDFSQLPICALHSDSVLPQAFIGPIICVRPCVAFSFQSVTYFPPQAFTVCDVTCLPSQAFAAWERFKKQCIILKH